VVLYDKRGQGTSDPDRDVPTLDDRLGDLTAVLDAAGAGRVALGGISEGGRTAAMYAATYPERASQLVLYGSFRAHGRGPLLVVAEERNEIHPEGRHERAD
jgi:pimeloyl-ACP methyl ester carboxylesterase